MSIADSIMERWFTPHFRKTSPDFAGYRNMLTRQRMDGYIAIHEVPSRGASAEGVWAWMWPNLAFNVYRGALVIEHMAERRVGHESAVPP